MQPDSAAVREKSAPRQYGWALAVVLLSVVASLGYVGVVLYLQTHALSSLLDSAEPIVNGNVRVLSQVQRELLRLETLIVEDDPDAERLQFHGDLTSQRMREAGLSYQVNTLGSTELLEYSQQLGLRWEQEGEQLLSQIIAGDTTATPQLRAVISELELGFNRLVSEAEISRRENASAANRASAELLAETRQVLVAGAAVAILLLLGTGMVGAVYIRFDRQRARTAERVEGLNAELRILSEVANHTRAMVIITDAAGVTTWVNEAFCANTGFAPDEIIGRRPGSVLQGPGTDRATVAMMREALIDGRGFTCEVVNHKRDGDPFWVRIEVQPVTDDDGVTTNFIAVESDITAQKELEERLRAAKDAAEETAAAKSSFLASMSHEIRTPLNAVIGLTALLEETSLDPVQREYVRTAASSGRLLLSVINDILNYSALEFGGVELEERPFAIRELAEQTVQLVRADARDNRLDVATWVDDDVAEVLIGDPTRLRQVLVNLLGNSVKFTDAGEVRLTVAVMLDGTDEQTLTITVTDTGIGIPANRLHRLFEPFTQVDASTTRRFGGSGLGLAICRDLVELMGGSIDVQSRPGVGTTVTLSLRLGTGDPSQLTEAFTPVTDMDRFPPADLRVLLVEDDKVNQTVAIHMLARMDIVPDVADDGRGALAAISLATYDVVLMDVNMPDIDGVTATRAIRDTWPPDRQPHIVAMTASALAGDRERLIAAGMDAYIAKPVQLQEFAAVLQAASEGRTADPPGDDPSIDGPVVRAGGSDPVVDMPRFATMIGTDDPRFLMSVVDVFMDEWALALPRLEAAASLDDVDRMDELLTRLSDAAAACAAARLADVLTTSPRSRALPLEAITTEVRRLQVWRASFRP